MSNKLIIKEIVRSADGDDIVIPLVAVGKDTAIFEGEIKNLTERPSGINIRRDYLIKVYLPIDHPLIRDRYVARLLLSRLVDPEVISLVDVTLLRVSKIRDVNVRIN